MGKMTWHGSGEKKFEAGVQDVALFVMGSNGSYKTGVPWNGVTAINENPSGADATELYADNVKYAEFRSAEKFGFTIEAYTYPDDWAECDGSASPKDGLYLGQQSRTPFALVYKTMIGSDTDTTLKDKYKLHIIYNSTASPSGRSYGTINENPDAMTMSWEASSTPVAVGSGNHKDVSSIVIDSTKVTYAAGLQAIIDNLYGRDADATNNITEVTPTMMTPSAIIDALTPPAGSP